MPHTRSPECTVTALSLSRDLLGRITREARRRGWSRAGFLRYAAARELGWPAAQARSLLRPELPPEPPRPAPRPRPVPRRPGPAARALERLATGRRPW